MAHGMMVLPVRRRTTARTATGVALTVMAADRAAAKRQNLALLVSELDARPEPKQKIKDVTRGRPASFDTFLEAEAAAVRAASFTQLMRYVQREMASLLALLADQPTADDVIAEEITAQADADKVQMMIREYQRRNDWCGMDRVVEATGRHALASQVLHAYALQLRDGMQKPRPVLHGGRAS